jgi:hypothetical protein
MSDQATLPRTAAMQSTDSLPVRASTPDLIDIEKVAIHIDRASGVGGIAGRPTQWSTRLRRSASCGSAPRSTLRWPIFSASGTTRRPFFRVRWLISDTTVGRRPSPNEVINLEKHIGGTIFDQLARIESYLDDAAALPGHRGVVHRYRLWTPSGADAATERDLWLAHRGDAWASPVLLCVPAL